MRDDLNTQNFSVPKIAHDLLSPWISCGNTSDKAFWRVSGKQILVQGRGALEDLRHHCLWARALGADRKIDR